MQRVLILDFGSQYTQLIARRVREAKVYSEIQPCTWTAQQVRAYQPQALILSGGPASVQDRGAPTLDRALLQLGIPVLGICYGMQALADALGGRLASGRQREYGRAEITCDTTHPLFQGLAATPQTVWMSHGDHVAQLPPGFTAIAQSSDLPIAAMANDAQRWYGLQFHPEVVHSAPGAQILHNFLFAIAGCRGDWSMGSFVEHTTAQLRAQVGTGRVVCGVSGGVDSSVVAVLLHRALGDQLECIFVDNGLLRKDEAGKIPRLFREQLGMQIRVAHAADRFLQRLQGVIDPELKRKKIGHEFIAVFEAEAKRLPNIRFLAQGTLYPDVIESVSFKGPSAVIKSHHNVGGLPEQMQLTLIEPLRELFKDEVRAVGQTLGMPTELLQRQPFPGPGLAVRIVGEITAARLATLRAADEVMMQEIKGADWYTRVWQSFCVLLPIQTVGVMGDQRTYEHVIALRVVTSQDGMTADWVPLPPDLLGRIASRIINEVRGINRVVYDITSKPPGTIEWE